MGYSLNNEAFFFGTKGNKRLKRSAIDVIFQKIRQKAGIKRNDSARYQPRLHDLRHTFAVHRLVQWYKEGADVQKMLPLLSVYMGHTHIASTSVYLTMTGELLQEAGKLFEQYARGETGESG